MSALFEITEIGLVHIRLVGQFHLGQPQLFAQFAHPSAKDAAKFGGHCSHAPYCIGCFVCVKMRRRPFLAVSSHADLAVSADRRLDQGASLKV